MLGLGSVELGLQLLGSGVGFGLDRGDIRLGELGGVELLFELVPLFLGGLELRVGPLLRFLGLALPGIERGGVDRVEHLGGGVLHLVEVGGACLFLRLVIGGVIDPRLEVGEDGLE